MQTKTEALAKLNRSKFRSSFKLAKKDRAYIAEKGLDVIESHARDFIRERLAPAYPKNDGTQTPTSGHPVFKAMHGCACCCRGCLNKWYNVPIGVELTVDQQDRIVGLLMAWIEEKNK